MSTPSATVEELTHINTALYRLEAAIYKDKKKNKWTWKLNYEYRLILGDPENESTNEIQYNISKRNNKIKAKMKLDLDLACNPLPKPYKTFSRTLVTIQKVRNTKETGYTFCAVSLHFTISATFCSITAEFLFPHSIITRHQGHHYWSDKYSYSML